MRIDLRTVFCGCLLTATSLAAADDDVEFFEKKIRPVLIAHCYECHSADSKTPGGNLLLDTRAGVLSGGDSGPAIHAGQPDESVLIKAIRYTDDSVKMPPKGKLPEAVIADLEEWVKRGAVDPRTESSKKKAALPWNEVMRERSDWWSLKPITTVGLPSASLSSWSDQPVDRFVRSKQNELGLTPAETTDPITLARRLSLVLTGLPPTADQVDGFVRDCHAEQSRDVLPRAAVERYVDSLLQSPHFGEQWARHWMDVVRFCETHGNEWNYEVHHAWRYRDYLIRAFNQDVPYDQFVREHIAGDLLPRPRLNSADQFNESIIGTGFYRFGEVNHDDCISLRSIGYDLADNQIDTLTKAFQATTVACARCHNHKLDAISAEDYYAMLAVMRSSRNVSHCIDSPQVNAEPKQRLRELKAELRQELASLWRHDATKLLQYLRASRAVRTNAAGADALKAGLDPVRLEKWIAVLANETLSLDDPFDLLRRLSESETPGVATKPADATAVSGSYLQTWEAAFQQFTQENSSRSEFNRSRFTNYTDFRESGMQGWLSGGMASLDSPTSHGEFVVQPEGDELVQAILPAGRYTHVLSAKLNGTLRSQVLAKGKKYISFEVLGQRSSAVRLVSSHCQLNYANYRALTSPGLHWVTFTIPEDREILQTYAELMTMFDNPKFPDQLSPLGGDRENYKLPWDTVAANPRSHFGVTRVVLHDEPGAPQTELSHLRSLYLSGDTSVDRSTSLANACPTPDEIASRYAARITSAIEAWAADRTSEVDVRWLDAMIRYQLLSNQVSQSSRGAEIVQAYRNVDAMLSLPRVVVGLGDGGPGVEQPVFQRGDYARTGEMVPRRYLEVMAMVRPEGSTSGFDGNRIRRSKLDVFTSYGSGRLELAEQITRPDNPLTARVMVNRIWHHLFGTGLVRTVDDFGHVGEQPSHPELLDYLAQQFVADGWSVKKMIRMLVLTRTFQLSNRPSEASREIDPQNRLLQHYPARRMEAESVRDSILVASGRLDRKLYGPSIQPYREKEYSDRRLFPGPLDGNGRRSIYIKNNLMEAPKFLAAFNFPGGKVTQGRRDVTNVPAQALALLNDPFVLQQAEVWSQRVLGEPRDSVPTRITSMFQSAVNRAPTAEEQARFERSIRELAALYQVPNENVMTNVGLWKDVAHALINMSELIYIP